MDDLVKKFGSLMFVVVFIGSAVDLFQAVWIVKRLYKRWKRNLYAKARREVLADEYIKRKELP